MKKKVIVFAFIIAIACILPSFISVAFAAPQIEYEGGDDTVRNIFAELKDEYGYDDISDELALNKTSDVAYGKVYKFTQMHNGVEVLGRGLNVSVNNSGKVLSVNDNYIKISGVKEVKLSEYGIEEVLSSFYDEVEITDTNKVIYSLEEYESDPIYAYDVSVSTEKGGRRIMVSAYDGQVIFDTDNANAIAVKTTQTDFYGNEVDVWLEHMNGNYYLSDMTRNIFTYGEVANGKYDIYTNRTGKFDDPMAVTVFNSVVKAYDFYTDANNIGVSRYGIDGRNDGVANNYVERGEVQLQLIVHYGTEYGNAFYRYVDDNYSIMAIGDGKLWDFVYNPGASLDIIGHEYQHGVTRYEANFLELNEAGAIDEAVSDIFGALIEGYELADERFWLIGEDSTYYTSTGALRSMLAPSPFDGSAANAKNKVPLCFENHDHDNAPCDRGGIHDNSTILTHMQYNVWSQMPEYFSKKRIGMLWYSTLCMLSQAATFEEFGECMIASATNLGFTQQAIDVIKENLFRSGITAGDDVHIVKFMNDPTKNYTLIGEVCVADGESVIPPAMPYKRHADPTKEWKFVGWDKPLDNVTEDMVVTANYVEAPKTCFVTFIDEDGDIFKLEKVPYGGDATSPIAGIQWDKSLNNVTDHMTVTAQTDGVKYYKVTFMSEGEVIDEQFVREGEAAIIPTAPTKESTKQYYYVFKGWSDASIYEVRSHLTVTAIFEEKLMTCYAHFTSDGEEYNSLRFNYGDALTFPRPPERKGYTFGGWYYDQEFTRKANTGDVVEGDLVLYAKWETGSSCASCGTVSTPLLPPIIMIFALMTVIIFVPKKRRQVR